MFTWIFAFIEGLCSCQDGVKCKLFILVSTVGTWATTEFIDEVLKIVFNHVRRKLSFC